LNKTLTSKEKFSKIQMFFGLHCFIIRNSTTAERIFQKLNQVNFQKENDVGLASNWNVFNFYLMNKILAIQRRDLFNSDIPTSGGQLEQKLNNSLIDIINKNV
jgi:hypothetical protein